MTAPPLPPPEPLMPLSVAAKPGARPREVLVDEATCERLMRELAASLEAIRAAKRTFADWTTPRGTDPLPQREPLAGPVTRCPALAYGRQCEACAAETAGAAEAAAVIAESIATGRPVTVTDDEPGRCDAEMTTPSKRVIKCADPDGHDGLHFAAGRRWAGTGETAIERVFDPAAGGDVLAPGTCEACGQPLADHARDGIHLDCPPGPGDELCGARPYPAGSEGDDGTECVLPKGHDGAHDDGQRAEVRELRPAVTL